MRYLSFSSKFYKCIEVGLIIYSIILYLSQWIESPFDSIKLSKELDLQGDPILPMLLLLIGDVAISCLIQKLCHKT